MASTEFLRNVPVLADLPDEALEQIAAEAREKHVPAGGWLLREGEEAESLYVITSGRLEVVDEGPPETVIRILRRGEVVGELALLSGSRRTISVRARRDSELLELSRTRFERLIADVPSFALGLVRSMGGQLAASRSPALTAAPPTTIAVLALDDGVTPAPVAETLASSLALHGSVATLTPDSGREPREMLAALDRAEAEEDRVVLLGGTSAPGDPWTDLCLREAGVVLALTSGRARHEWLEHPDALAGCELIVVGAEAEPALVSALAPREVQTLAGGGDLPRCIEATARRLAGKAVGVVLSGGGARAFAHVGVMDELNAAGIAIDRIAGVSLGSLVAGGIALGYEPDGIHEVFEEGFTLKNPTGDYTLPLFSLVRGKRSRDLLRKYFGGYAIEALEKRYFCLSCDLIGREPVIHRTGPMLDAVHASLSIPGVFPPRPTPDGRLLVDGGVLDNLPVGTMARTGEGPVIAVDVTGKMGGFKKPSRPGIARLGRPIRRFLTGSEEELPRLAETVVRTVTVGSIDTAAQARLHADLVIQPEVDSIGLLDWAQLDSVREMGREAARRALAASEEWAAW